ncbi:ABC transporter substrate-binding protein [Actinacidiphila bryophytorum]|uniref:ABC transporter substrate-binding protein n=1 Tax=Actinacidiphila bryophytorum TaxID=1436133 RepID=UPI002176AEDB|nr:ABC transporter substrate-binding protein [Actinacidiphila bryophytorum]UWE13877.1 ABC transporter substrate-binding protein [Actinacidiphila bryophytorum]
MRKILVAAGAAALLLPLAGCGSGTGAGGGGKTVTVHVGYQSKTINTVTAGTLLRSLGYFEQQLAALGRRDGTTYKVDWQDYATGAPITAQMVAGKIDVGSMGDYPLLINAARGVQMRQPTELVSVTGYNLRGGLNMVVTAPGSTLKDLSGLRGGKVSTSIGSAADGTLVRALQQRGIDADKDLHKLNQQPAVGASALQAGSVDALSQFVAWPGQLVFQGKAKALYDGAALDLPTFHGVTVRKSFAKQRPSVVDAFLAAQIQATDYLHAHPLQAAQKVADATGLPPEVVYLYNGPGGIAAFDPTIKPQLLDAFAKDVPVLASEKLVGKIDISHFADDSFIRRAVGADYGRQVASLANPAPVTGTDPTCGGNVADPATASEAWPAGQQQTAVFTTPSCLLRYLAGHPGAAVRAAYVPDALTGTRWFADRAVWAADPAAPAKQRFQPFTTPENAATWLAAHPGAHLVGFAQAVAQAAAQAAGEAS